MRHSDSELVAICQHELARSSGSGLESGNLTQNRRMAQEYYLARSPAGPDIPGRSQVVSPDVRNVITNLSAEMTNLWQGEYPAEFEQEAPDDEGFEGETYAVRQVLERCDLDKCLGDASFDAMLMKNGIIKVWCTDIERRETRTLKNATAQEIAAFMAQLPEEASLTTTGDDAHIEIPWRDRRVCLEATDPANLLVSQQTRSNNLEDARFVAERKFMTRSDLVADGYPLKVVDQLPAFSFDTKEDTYTRRIDQTSGDETAETHDQDTLEVYECYLLIDLNGDKGKSDRWRLMVCEETLLSKERVNYVPYVSGSVMNFPHRWEGISIFDLTKESQDIGTAGWRQWIDNNATGIQNRMVLGPGINVADVEAAGPNKHVRMTRGDDVRQQAMPLPFNDVGPSIESMMGYKNQLRTEATGASTDLHGDEQQIMSSQIGSMGAERVMNSQEAIAAYFLRNFTTSIIKNLFLLVHRCLREDYGQPVMVRVGDQWGQSDPRTWRPRYAVAVRSGMSSGERNRKIGALSTHLQVMNSAMQAGMTITDEKRLYALLMDLARAQELESAEQYYLDPESPEAQQVQQQRAEQQQQQQQMAAQMETLGDQVKMQIAQLNDATERLKIAAQMEMKEAEIVGSAQTQLSLKELEIAQNMGGDEGDGQPANGAGTG